TFGRTPWAGDQLVARPLPVHKQKNTYTDIHASSVIRNHDPSDRAGQDDSCLRLYGHCDWLCLKYYLSEFFRRICKRKFSFQKARIQTPPYDLSRDS
ncbi:hypothetical protein B7P43_G11417, partial [Cryptotermes secundus]